MSLAKNHCNTGNKAKIGIGIAVIGSLLLIIWISGSVSLKQGTKTLEGSLTAPVNNYGDYRISGYDTRQKSDTTQDMGKGMDKGMEIEQLNSTLISLNTAMIELNNSYLDLQTAYLQLSQDYSLLTEKYNTIEIEIRELQETLSISQDTPTIQENQSTADTVKVKTINNSKCPDSCDDNNPCTLDQCSADTDFKCEYLRLDGGDQTGCSGTAGTCKEYTCESGECDIISITPCCGNEVCESKEDYNSCPDDCPKSGMDVDIEITELNLSEEWVEITNNGDVDVDMSNWTLEDNATNPHTYLFPSGFILDDGSSVKVHTGDGNDTSTELYWGFGGHIWNNNGDTATLKDSNGKIISQMS